MGAAAETGTGEEEGEGSGRVAAEEKDAEGVEGEAREKAAMVREDADLEVVVERAKSRVFASQTYR